jgi:Tol biopolymer transport system component
LPWGDASQTCDPSLPFNNGVPLAGVDAMDSNDGAGRLSPDELTIYFFSDRLRVSPGDNDVFMATRASITEPFGAPQPVGGVSTDHSTEGWPSVTGDGLTMYLEADTTRVLSSRRMTPAAQFPAASPVVLSPGDASAANVGQPFILPDESALYFVSNRPDPGSLDLFRAERDATSSQFGVPAPVEGANSSSSEYAPTLSADELILYFGSGRKESPAQGNQDIWMTRRASRTATFDPPVNVRELNTAAEEWPSWLSPDGCRLYFTRVGATGRKMWVAERPL